jgi:hypothetical protein
MKTSHLLSSAEQALGFTAALEDGRAAFCPRGLNAPHFGYEYSLISLTEMCWLFGGSVVIQNR